MDILTPIECFGFGTIFILLAVLRNIIGGRATGKLSLEIDHGLKMLRDFWEEKQGHSNKSFSFSEASIKKQQIVVSKTKTSITTDSIDSIEHDIDLPQWHRNIFDMPTSLYCLSSKTKQNVRQFYDNLEQITSRYNKIKKYGDKIAEKTNLKEKFETLVTKVIDNGNPLKT